MYSKSVKGIFLAVNALGVAGQRLVLQSKPLPNGRTRGWEAHGGTGYQRARHALLGSLNRDIAKERPGIAPSEISLDNVGGSLQTILSTKSSELEMTAQRLDHSELRATLRLLSEASIIQIVAVGNTIPVAMDAAFKFNQLGLRSITSEINEKASAFSLTLTKQDLLVLISNSGKSRRLMQIAQVARSNGVPIVLLTSETESPLVHMSDHVLTAVNRERLLTTREFQLSRIPLTFVVEVLYYFLYSMLPDPKHHISLHESMMASDKKLDA